MNSTARALNAAADVICAAQAQDRTPMGIALALDSAGMLMPPETAAELEHLRGRVRGLEQLLAEDRPVDEDPIAYELTEAGKGIPSGDGFTLPSAKALRSSARLRWLLGSLNGGGRS